LDEFTENLYYQKIYYFIKYGTMIPEEFEQVRSTRKLEPSEDEFDFQMGILPYNLKTEN